MFLLLFDFLMFLSFAGNDMYMQETENACFWVFDEFYNFYSFLIMQENMKTNKTGKMNDNACKKKKKDKVRGTYLPATSRWRC